MRPYLSLRFFTRTVTRNYPTSRPDCLHPCWSVLRRHHIACSPSLQLSEVAMGGIQSASQQEIRNLDPESAVDQKDDSGLAAEEPVGPTDPLTLGAEHVVVHEKDPGLAVGDTVTPADDGVPDVEDVPGGKDSPGLAVGPAVDPAEDGALDAQDVLDHKDDRVVAAMDTVNPTEV